MSDARKQPYERLADIDARRYQFEVYLLTVMINAIDKRQWYKIDIMATDHKHEQELKETVRLQCAVPFGVTKIISDIKPLFRAPERRFLAKNGLRKFSTENRLQWELSRVNYP